MMTDAQMTTVRNMAQDGRMEMKDLAAIIADFLIYTERRTGTTRERLKSELWYASQRVVADHPLGQREVGGAVQTVWREDPVR